MHPGFRTSAAILCQVYSSNLLLNCLIQIKESKITFLYRQIFFLFVTKIASGQVEFLSATENGFPGLQLTTFLNGFGLTKVLGPML